MQSNKQDHSKKPATGNYGSGNTGKPGSVAAPKKPEHTGSCGGDKGKKGSCS
ncbi:MAG: hypothetical protein KGQ70_05930 [Alphaproteobacteria bacterium]|nr:hypothetical protein [Alphaproteobacteria bacterium]